MRARVRRRPRSARRSSESIGQCVSSRDRLIEHLSLRREQDDRSSGFVLPGDIIQRRSDGLDLHHHPGSAAVGIVIHYLVPAFAVFADVMQAKTAGLSRRLVG